MRLIFRCIVGLSILISSTTLAFASSHPVIEGLDVKQLHQNYTDTPHRYELTALFSGGTAPFKFSWKIDCGQIVSATTTSVIEWHYTTPGECENAILAFAVLDSSGNGQAMVASVFDPEGKQIRDIVATNVQPSPSLVSSPTATSSSMNSPVTTASQRQPFSVATIVAVALIVAVILLTALFVLTNTPLVKEKCAEIEKKIDALKKNLLDIDAKRKQLREKIKQTLSEMQSLLKDKTTAIKTFEEKEQQLKDIIQFQDSVRNELAALEAELETVNKNLQKVTSERLIKKSRELKADVAGKKTLQETYDAQFDQREKAYLESQKQVKTIDTSIKNKGEEVEEYQKELVKLDSDEQHTYGAIATEEKALAACRKLVCVEGEMHWDEYYSTKTFTIPDRSREIIVYFDTGPLVSEYMTDADINEISQFLTTCNRAVGLTGFVARKLGLIPHLVRLPVNYTDKLLDVAKAAVEAGKKLRLRHKQVFESIRMLFPVKVVTVYYVRLHVCRGNKFVPEDGVKVVDEVVNMEYQVFQFPNRGDYVFSEEVPQIMDVLRTHPQTLADSEYEYELFTRRQFKSSPREKQDPMQKPKQYKF